MKSLNISWEVIVICENFEIDVSQLLNAYSDVCGSSKYSRTIINRSMTPKQMLPYHITI